jgi:hypothetical protein
MANIRRDAAATFVPAVPPPPGVELDPDHANRELQRQVTAVAVIFPLLAFAFTFMRFYTAKFVIGRFRFDDCTSFCLG